MTHFSLFLALRYLRPKRTFVSIITLISILGVTLGVTVLILVISVMTGFDREIRKSVLEFDAHLMVGTGGVLYDWREALQTANHIQGIVGVAPFVQGPVILQGPPVEGTIRRTAPKLRGIDPELELSVVDPRRFIIEGEFKLEENETILGSRLAQTLGVHVGDTVSVYSPGNLDAIFTELDKIQNKEDEDAAVTKLREMVLPADLTVTGIFETGRLIYDSEFFLVPLHVGQELYMLGDGVHGLTAKTSDPYHAALVRDQLLTKLPADYQAHTWIDMNRDRFEAIRLERSVMFFLLFFIVLVAAFGIMNTLITVTVQKTREIGIMKALGATTAQVVWVFLAQGMVVGLFGTLAGLGLGMWLVQYRNQVRNLLSQLLGIQVFPQQIYEFAEIPAEIIPSDVAIICGGAFLICTLAALLPAWNAARLDPVKALRHE